MSELNAPEPDEIEISVFGKGIGECCVVHLGNNEWIVIDSFLDDIKQPIAASYLTHIGVNLEQVKFVCLTHWHDDHIRGSADLVNRCPTALVSYSAVLRSDEFKGAISNFAPNSSSKFPSGVEELIKISGILKSRPAHRRLASADRTLFRGTYARVDALSPSDEDFQNFLGEIASWNTPSDVERVLPIPNRNDISVVISVEIDSDRFLFGADLEIQGPLSGWQAVHDLYWQDRGKCSFYKIAHHGSANGHYGPKWSNMLVKEVAAVLTPYGRGRKKLPSNDDIARINGLTSRGFSAGNVAILNGRRQNATVERTLREASIDLKRMSDKLGHVRARKKIGEDTFVIERFGEACALADSMIA